MFNKIKDLKNLRDQASQIKSMLAEETVHADAAHGNVQLVMNGNQEVLSIDIDPAMLSEDKKEELQKALADAMNDAVKKAQRVMAQKMQSMGGLPGM